MKLKKLLTAMIIIAIIIAQLSGIKYVYATNTESVNSNKFHYSELNDVAKNVYDGIYEMYINGILKTGTESFDLSTNDKYVTQAQLERYMQGDKELTQAMNAARYAFYADYPEVFYVNFQKLSLRVTKDVKNKYHAKIGPGNLQNYYVDGFTDANQVNDANAEFNNIVSEIVEKANRINVDQGENLQVAKIKYVHNELINTTGYRLESDCTEGNEGFLGTPYGALVKHQAVCEGYARALKTILDKIGVNSILVQGLHQSEGSAAVPHMWNYVQIDKESNTRSTEKVWYAIDATMDDPFLRDETIDTSLEEYNPGDDIKEGFENTRFCLAGMETMHVEHTVLPMVEAAGNYTFDYPEISQEDYGIDTTMNSDGLLVKYKEDGTETQEYKAGDFYISYEGKGYKAASEDGKYILIKYHEYRPGDDKWIEGNWGYLNPELYAHGAFNDNGDHVYISVPNGEYMEFAVTTLAPSEGLAGLTYQGDGSDFLAQSGKIYNPSGIYKARPYIKEQSPIATYHLSVGRTYHIDVTYDDDLVLAEGATEAGYRFDSTGSTGEAESTITNFQFDGKRRITFDMQFSKMFADDGARYHIYITGLVGKNSNKVPMEISYGAQNVIACAYRSNLAKSWGVFARPSLIENNDLSLQGWETSDGKAVSDKLKARIALVTTRTTTSEKEKLNDIMQNEFPDQEVLSSETYNISLNVCRDYIKKIKDGHKVRLSVGFPKGYGPEDEGVIFKAYHFMQDNKGNVTGVEEIPCVVTKYGLIITCDSFSPFTIVAAKGEEVAGQDKTVVISETEGGSVEGTAIQEGGLITLKSGETKSVNIKADEGYQIEKIEVCGKNVQITNKKEMPVNVSYDDVINEECIVKATFVAETVVQKDQEQGEFTVTPVEIVRGFEVSLDKANQDLDLLQLECEDEFEINVHMKNLSNVGKGLIVLAGQLEYDTNILERVSIEGKNGWYIKDNKVEALNPNNNMFIAENDEYVYESTDILTVKFKVKETATEPIDSIIKLKNISSSGGYGIINAKDTEVPIAIIKSTPSEKKIKSDIYYVNETDKDITKIEPGTTVESFKENITTENIEKDKLVFTNKDGEQLDENGILTTGVVVTGGETLRYTLVVSGDVNGQYYVNSKGEIIIVDTDDLAKVKLKFLKEMDLTGIDFKAADCNYNGEIDVDDIAKIKLIILGL